MRLLLCLFLAVGWWESASAIDCGIFAPYADSTMAKRYGRVEPTAPRPSYLVPQRVDTRLNSIVTRISADSGDVVVNISGSVWGSDGRHQYSKRQAWNSDNTLIYIENADCKSCDAAPQGSCSGSDDADSGSPSPSRVFLDGNTYVPQNLAQSHSNFTSLKDPQWHPHASYADYMIGVADSATGQGSEKLSRLRWVNVRTGAIARSWGLPILADGIGPYEGAPSNDGRYIAIVGKQDGTNDNRVVVVDMDGAGRVGSVYDLASAGCGLCNSECTIGNKGHVAVSSKGTYLVAAYSGDFHRVFNIDWTSTPPAITGPRNITGNTYTCYNGNPALSGADGWIMPLKHADLVTYDNVEYVVGIDKCFVQDDCAGSTHADAGLNGKLVVVKVADGAVRHISRGSTGLGSSPCASGANEEIAGLHVSARNLDGQTAWVFASYDKSGSTSSDSCAKSRMMDEIVAWSMDPAGKAVKRLGWTHSAWSNGLSYPCYRAEAHPSPSRDGKRVLFASNWQRNTATSGDEGNYAPNMWRKSYVLDTRPTPKAITDLVEVTPRVCSDRALRWTAPVDDWIGNSGTVSSYVVMYSTSPLTEANFYNGTQVAGPTPATPGTQQDLTVTGLAENVTYYFAVKAVGTCGPRSGMSNVLTSSAGATDVTPPGDVADLGAGAGRYTVAISWTAPGDDGSSCTAAEYDLRWSNSPITSGNFSSANRLYVSAPQVAGTPECTVMSASSCTWYYFALKTRDEANNWSGISNLPSVKTKCTGSTAVDCAFGLTTDREGESEVEADLPAAFALFQNEPNPFDEITSIRFDLPRAVPVRLEIFDLAGRRVASLANGVFPAGRHELEWNHRTADGTRVGPGVYLYQLQAGAFRDRKKMMLLP